MLVESTFRYVFDWRFVYQLSATLATYLIISIIQFYYTRAKRYTIFRFYGIPGPEPRLLDGHLGLYKKEASLFLMDAKLMKQYGKIYGVFFGDEPNIVITDLNLIRKVFFEETQSFRERCTLFIDGPLNQSILFVSHHRWKAMRKVISPAFTRYNIHGKSSLFIEDISAKMCSYIDNRLKDSDNKLRLDVHMFMKSVTLSVISEIALKLPDVGIKEFEPNVKSLDDFLELACDGVVNYAIMFPFLRRILNFITKHFEYNATMSRIDRNLEKIIDDGLNKLKSKPHVSDCYDDPNLEIIDIMIKLHYQGKLTRAEVMGNAQAIIFAGYDTSSTTMTYILWALTKHPEIQEQLRQELLVHGIDSKLLMRVINETMRLYPSVVSFTIRLATSTVTIDQQTIPQGTKVVANSWLVHRHPDFWSDPLKFDPERFTNENKIDPCAFFPFGLGERRCLGYQLALLEMKLLISTILLKYRLKLISPQELELKIAANVLTKPAEPVIIEFIPVAEV